MFLHLCFLNATAECFARLSHRLAIVLAICPSLCLSVRLSVTPWHCIKTVQAKITKSSLWAAPRTLVLVTKFHAPRWGGSPRTMESKRGTPVKDVILPVFARIVWKRLQIGRDMLLIITNTGDRLFTFINIDDLERPWTPPPKKKEICEFFAIFGCSAHFNTDLRRNGWRYTKTTWV